MDSLQEYEFDIDFIRNEIYYSEGVLPYPTKDPETGEVTYPYVYKVWPKIELDNYLFYMQNDPEGIVRFLPELVAYSSIDAVDIFKGKGNWDHGDKARNTVILLKNLGAELTHHSFIDFKLGTTHGKQNRYLEKPDYYKQKAIKVGSAEKAYYLFEVKHKNQETGDVIKHELKNYTLDDKAELQTFFSDKDGVLNNEFLKQAINTIEEMIEQFLTTKFELEHRWLSLLFIVDHINSVLKTNFVDIWYVEPLILDEEHMPLTYKDENGVLRDGAVILGLKNIKQKLQEILDESK